MKIAKHLVVVLVLSLALIFATCARAADGVPANAGPQKLCPVLSGKIDKNLYTDYMGKRVYYCCSGCKVEFMKDPEKFIKKMEDQGIQIEKSPTN